MRFQNKTDVSLQEAGRAAASKLGAPAPVRPCWALRRRSLAARPTQRAAASHAALLFFFFHCFVAGIQWLQVEHRLALKLVG